MVSLSLEYGNCDGSCFGYAWFAMLAGPQFNNYKDGYRFGQLGFDLVEKRGLTRYQARTYITFANGVIPWAKHVASERELIRRAFDLAYRAGDLTFAAYQRGTVGRELSDSGRLRSPRSRRKPKMVSLLAKRVGFGYVIHVCGSQLGLVRTLRGLTPTFGCLDYDDYNELDTERSLASNPMLSLAEFCYWTRKMQARFFAGDFASAVDASLKAQRLLWTAPSQIVTADFRLYAALAHAAAWHAASPEGQALTFRSLDSSPQAARGVGRALPGKFRGSRDAGPCGNRADRRPDPGRREALRRGDPSGTRERLCAQRGGRQRAGRALLRGARLREGCDGLPEGCPLLLPALGCGRKGSTTRATLSAPQGGRTDLRCSRPRYMHQSITSTWRP